MARSYPSPYIDEPIEEDPEQNRAERAIQALAAVGGHAPVELRMQAKRDAQAEYDRAYGGSSAADDRRWDDFAKAPQPIPEPKLHYDQPNVDSAIDHAAEYIAGPSGAARPPGEFARTATLNEPLVRMDQRAVDSEIDHAAEDIAGPSGVVVERKTVTATPREAVSTPEDDKRWNDFAAETEAWERDRKTPSPVDPEARAASALSAKGKEPDAGFTQLPAAREFVGPGSRDNARAEPSVSPWALLADAVLNHGNGTQGILAQVQQEKENIAKRRNSGLDDEYKRAQIEHLKTTGKASSDWEADKSARDWANIDLRSKGIDQGGERVGLAKTRAESLADPQSALRLAEVEVAKRRAAAGVEGREGQKHALIDQTTGDARQLAAARSEAGTQARIETTHEYAPVTTEDARIRAGEVAKASGEAALPSKQALKTTASAAEQRAQENQDLARSDMPGVVVKDRAAWDAMNITPEQRAKTTQYVRGVQGGISALDKMIDIRARRGPIGLTDQDKAMLSDLQKEAIGSAAVAGNSGVLNGGEFPRYAADIPDGSLAGTDVLDRGINGLTGSKRDTVLEKLKAQRATFVHALNSGLSVGGAQYAESASAPPPAAPRTAAPPSDRPVSPDDARHNAALVSEGLPSTGAAPKVNAVVAFPPYSAGRTYTLVAPDGQTQETELDPAAYEQLVKRLRGPRGAGWSMR